jgi:hypothetical protein
MAVCRISSATTITSDNPEFTLRVPDGYVQLHDTDKIQFGGINLYGFASTNATYGAPDCIVFIQQLGRSIDRQPIDVSSPEVKSLFASVGLVDAHVVKAHWSSFDVSMIDGQATKNGILWAASVAQVPIDGNAVQICVLVRPDEGETEAENVARDFLDGLTGPSNWSTDGSADSGTLTPFQRGERFGQGLGTMAIIVVCAGIVIRKLRRD